MIKILFIISQRNFNDEEYSVTRKVLEENEIKVSVSSIDNGEAIGMKGLKVNPDKTVRRALEENYDGLVIIGGSGSPTLSDYPEVLEIIRAFNTDKKTIGAICLAPVVLGKAGILSNIMVTVYPIDWAITSITRDGAHYFKHDIVEDENIITADGPKSARKFGEAIVKRFKHENI
jgi:protease I